MSHLYWNGGTRVRLRFTILLTLLAAALLFFAYTVWHNNQLGYPTVLAGFTIERPASKPTMEGSYLAGYVAQNTDDMRLAAQYYQEAMKLDPKSELIRQSAYKALLLSGKTDEATKIAEGFLKDQPDSVSATILTAVEFFKHKQYKQAEAVLDSVNLKPEQLRMASVDMLILPYLEAWTKLAQGHHDDALSYLERMFADNQVFFLLTHYQRALMLDEMGKNQDAYEEYKKALGRLTMPYNVVFRAGNLMEKMGKTDEAKALYEKYQQVHPYTGEFSRALQRIKKGEKMTPVAVSVNDGVVEVLLEAARVLLRSNYPVEALAYVRLGLYFEPENEQALVMLAHFYESKEDYAKANEAYAKVLPDSNLIFQVEVSQSKNDFKMGKKDEAENALKMMLKSEKDGAKVATILTLADLLRNDNQFGKAVAYYDQAIKELEAEDSADWSVYFAAGISYERAKKWKKAEEYLKKAMELQPDRPEVLNYLGYSWIDRGVHTKEARELIAKALKLSPDDSHIIDSMGWAYYKLGDYEMAVKYLEKAAEITPYDDVINDHLGDTYWRLGRKREARFQWQRVLEYRNEDADEVDFNAIQSKLEKGL